MLHPFPRERGRHPVQLKSSGEVIRRGGGELDYKQAPTVS